MSTQKTDDSTENVEANEKPTSSQISEKVLLSTGIRVGTLVKTKAMGKFVSRTRPDGLHVIDVSKILSRIEAAGRFIARSDISRVVVYSARDYGKTPVNKFCELTGAISLTGRFMPGTFTNPLFTDHIDPEILLVTDPAMDKQAVTEASKMGIPVVAICDTDNVTSDVDLIIPANNRGRKALAATFWLLAKTVLLHLGSLNLDQPMKYNIEDFETKLTEEKDDAE